MQALLDHRWPGNVRELENAIKAAVAMADGTIIHRDALPATIVPLPAAPGRAASLIDIDRPLPEVTDDLVGRVERETSPACSSSTRATSPGAPATAASPAAASPRSSRSTTSTARSSAPRRMKSSIREPISVRGGPLIP